MKSKLTVTREQFDIHINETSESKIYKNSEYLAVEISFILDFSNVYMKRNIFYLFKRRIASMELAQFGIN